MAYQTHIVHLLYFFKGALTGKKRMSMLKTKIEWPPFLGHQCWSSFSGQIPFLSVKATLILCVRADLLFHSLTFSGLSFFLISFLFSPLPPPLLLLQAFPAPFPSLSPSTL